MGTSDSIVVVATLVPTPGHETEVQAALLNAVARTHAEDAGCELYAAHQSVRGKEGFVVIEKWASQAALTAHGAGAAFAQLSAAVKDLLVEPFGVTVLRPLPVDDSALGRV